MSTGCDGALRTVSNALAVLESFDSDRGEQGVTELSHRLDLHKSVVFRVLKTLELHGWIQQNRDSRYSLTLKAFEIGSRAVAQLGLGTHIQPFLDELARTTGETVNVGVMDGEDVLYVNKVVPDRVLRLEVQIGVRMPAACTAMGKILMGFAPEDEREALLQGFEGRPCTAGEPAVARKSLRDSVLAAQTTGLCWSDGELFPEICCVAAPIRNSSGRVIAALSIATQNHGLSSARREYLEAEVMKTAVLISRHRGWLSS